MIDKNCQMASVSGTVNPESFTSPPGAHLVKLYGLSLARSRKKRRGLSLMTTLFVLAVLNFQTQFLVVNAAFSCDLGYTTEISSTQSVCKICPAGKACATATSAVASALTCIIGSFAYSNIGQSACTQIPTGFYTGAANIQPKACAAGQLQNAAKTSCTACTSQDRCGDPSVPLVTCAANQIVYSTVTGHARAYCASCPASSTCTSGTIGTCAAGKSAVWGSGVCSAAAVTGKAVYSPAIAFVTCPAGTYTSTSATTCAPCPAGNQCSNSSTSTACLANEKADAGQNIACAINRTGYYPRSTAKTALDFSICGTGKYYSSGIICTTCTINQQCVGGAAPSACPTTEQADSTGVFAVAAFYSLAGEGTCHHVPYGYQNSGGTLTACAVGQQFTAKTATCVTCSNTSIGMCSSVMDTAVQGITCQITQYLKNVGTTSQACVTCDVAGSICPDPTLAVQNQLQILTGAVTKFSPGQAEGVPYSACYTYGQDGKDETKTACQAFEYAVKGRAVKTCSTTQHFQVACDIASTIGCPTDCYPKSPYYFCVPSALDKAMTGSGTGASEVACTSPTTYSWYGEVCVACTTPAIGTKNAIYEVGNQCKALYELNAIPCQPGSASLLGLCDTSENTKFADGIEIMSGMPRQCYTIVIGTTTIYTGSIQKGSLPGIDTALPEYQCQDCPELQSCGIGSTSAYNVYCWGQALPLSCYNGVGFVDPPTNLIPCPKNLYLDDRRLQRNDGMFCQDANARYHQNRMITFATHYFLDHNDDTKEYLDCPFQTATRTVSRHIFWEDDCTTPPCWSITGRNQLGVDGEKSRPKGATTTDWVRSDKATEAPKRNRKGFYMTDIDTSGDYISKVWFMDDDIYEYPYCKVDKNYFNYSVLDGHKKTSWEFSTYKFFATTQQVTYTCPIYKYLNPNYPICTPNYPGFISKTATDTQTNKAIGEAQTLNPTQYLSYLENKGTYTGITMSDCPQFQWMIPGYEGGVSANFACRIGEMAQCLSNTADYCHSGQDFYCPEGMKPKSGNTRKTINDCEACTAGSYCSTGSSSTCPAGYNCPAYTVNPNMLPSQPGQVTSTAPNTATAFTTCQYGYCPGKTATGVISYCPAGFYNNFPSFTTGQFSAANCSPNPPGQKTLAASSTISSTSVNYTACTAGTYCPQGSNTGIFCPPGSFSAGVASSLNDCTTCIAGKFCGLGSSVVGNCPAGKYCPLQTFFQYEYTCPIGMTIASGQSQSTEANCSTSCAQGQYCREGADAADATLCDAAFYVCPAASSRTTCAPGSYTKSGSTAATSAGCSACAIGSFCVGNGPTDLCEMGYIATTPSASTCALTSGGMYTDARGSLTPKVATVGNWALTTGDIQQTKCEYGQFCNGAGVKIDCPFGKYCPLGTATQLAISAGSVQLETKLWFDKPCRAGYFCAAGAADTLVSRGYYTKQGAAADATTLCTAGYNCIKGSIGSKMLACDINTWFTAASDCTTDTQCCTSALCTAGKYCIQGFMNTCPLGFYCPNPRGTNMFEVCPKGTYQKTLGGTLSTGCTKCDAGYGCVEPGAADKYKQCGAGYYCFLGSPTTTPLIYCSTVLVGVTTPTYDSATSTCTNGVDAVVTTTLYGVCPVGYYCPLGTLTPQVCPIGTFSGAYAARAATDCIDCTEGYYCSGATAKSQCQAGTYCPIKSGAETAIVASGYWSEARYPAAIKCFPGTYLAAADTPKSTCKIADPGSYQQLFGQAVQNACIAGHDCNAAGIIYPRMCLYGQYAGTPNGACTACQQHSYCAKNAQTAADATTYKCPSGYVCQSGADNQYMNIDFYAATGAQAYFQSLTATNYLCPRGFFCDATIAPAIGVDVFARCAAGTFMPAIGATAQASCIDCPFGYVCDFSLFGTSHITPQACPSGQYCVQKTGGAILAADCIAGQFCSAKAGAAYKCPWGTYQDLTKQLSCKQCPDGKMCSTESLQTVEPCSINHYCQQDTGLGASISLLCLEGELVLSSVLNPNSKTLCTDIDKNHWWRSSGVDQSAVLLNGLITDGYLWGKTGAKDKIPSTATVCQSGFFCVAGDAFPCTNGKWCNNRLRSVDGDACPAGYYCIQKTNPDTLILSGTTYKSLMTQFCQPGSACPLSTLDLVGQKCAVGTYSSAYGLVAISECHDCPEGYVCNTTGMTWATVNVPAQKCPAGKYCLNKTDGATITAIDCTIGTYCTGGNIERIVCEGGQFTDATLQSVCKTCVAGTYCPWTPGVLTTPASQTTACDIGFKCSVGSLHQPEPCSPGTYQNTGGQITCLGCPIKFYCPQGSMSVPIACPDTMRCPANSIQPVQCQDGENCDINNTDTQSGTTGMIDPRDVTGATIAYSSCPSGYYCKMGRKFKCYAGYVCTINSITPTPTNGQGGYICPKGYWCAEGTLHKAEVACAINFFQPSFGAEAITDCQACSVGYTCSSPGSTFQTPTVCPAGKICNSDGTQTDCQPGFYCPTGAVAMIPCEDGTYQDLPTKTACNKCPAGKYCSKVISGGVVSSGATIGIDCPIGYYCPDGTPYSNSFPCLPGTYSDDVAYQVPSQVLDAITGAVLYKGCKPCPATNYCPLIAMTNAIDWTTLHKCKDGYLCRGGNMKEIGNDLCPYDNYCNKGLPTPCPSGSFVQVQGTTSIDECIQCPPGKICPTLSVGIQDCPEGYYCDVGNYSSLDPAVSGIKVCQIGNYCPKGSVMQLKCNPGTYQDQIQQKECITCPLGKYCPDSGMSVTKPCDATNGFENWYCPPGSIYPRVCGIGQTFDTVNYVCKPCPSGKYCWPEPLTFSSDLGVRGDCNYAQGYVCRSGSYAIRPQQKNLSLILAGSSLFQTYNGPIIRGYQVDAVGNATPCPAGSYQPSAFSTGCIRCMKGRYCDKPGLYSLVENICKGGYECDYSQIRADPPAMKCPAGYQCPSKVPTKLVCEDGFYSDVAGLVVCQPCPAGKYCKNDNTDVLATQKTCNTNSVCNGGSPRQPNCPDGMLLTGSSCNNCTAGNYCRSGMVSGPCAAGYICNGTVNADPNPSGFECAKGSYCGMGVTSGLKCPYKTMSIADKQRQITDCRGCQPGYVCEWGVRDYYPCPKGYYCPPVGDMTSYTQYQYACPAGTYNSETLRAYLADCQICDEGRYCGKEAMQDVGPLCPRGHFCPLGTIAPMKCGPGTYVDFDGASFENDCQECPIGFYCPAGSTQPITCEPGYQCPGDVALMIVCPGGYFCSADTLFLPEICQPNYYCPMGTGKMLPCTPPYVCDWGTEYKVLCGPGYHVIDYGIPGTPNQCQACPRGFFSNMDIPGCRPCTPGYVCYGKTNTPFPSIFNDHNGVYCPRGHYCPLGTYDPFPCPPGTYNPDENAESELKCRACKQNTFNDLYGAEGCKPCGQFATSKEEAAICSCIGSGRLYSLADASCRCQSGYDFKDSNGVTQAQASSIQDCYPIVFDRCTNFGNGTDFVRTPDGTCKRYDDCANSCAGEPGIRSSVTGICTCSNEKSVDVTCNQDCRNSAASIEYLSSYQILITYADGTTEKVSLTEAGDSYGKVICTPGQDCTAVSVEIGANGFGGTYNLPQLIDNQIAKQKTRRMRLLNSQKLGGRSDSMVPTNSTYTNTSNTINVRRNSSAESYEKNSSSELDDLAQYESRRLQQTSQNIVTNPTYCLKQNQTMLFSIPTPYHYPTYMRDSVLNSQISFDYGQFLQLEKNMKRKQATGDMSSSFFSFTFIERGNYVFQDASDLNSLLIVSVKGRGETCPDPSRYVQSSSSTNIAELGVKIKDRIIQKPNYLLYGFLIAILVICTAIALVMIGYCLRKNWTIEDMAVSSYRENQYQLEINHDNDQFYEEKNDFIQHKSDLIIDEEDDLDNFNLEIQQDLMDSGKKYLKLFAKKKNKIKKFKVSRRDKLNELIRVINQDMQLLQDTVEEKRLRFLDMDKLHLLDENQMKEQIEQELEAQKERERQEDELYNKRKDEMLADASKRDLNKYQNLISGMKHDINKANKELNNVIGMEDLTEEQLLKRKEMAIHDNGDLNSKANKLVWEIENNPNLNDQEKAALMHAHEEAMLELKIQMDHDRKKQEKELDRALQDKLARRKRLREEQYKKQIKEETKQAEKDVEKTILQKKMEEYEAIKQQLDRDMETVDYLPTVEQKKRSSELEEEAQAKRHEIDSGLEDTRKNLIEQRKKEIAQKFLSGAENDDDLRKEIQDLLSQHGSGKLGAQILAQAEDQKKSEEEKLKERLAQRKAQKEREREKQSQKIEKDLDEQDIMDVTELENVKNEAFFRKKLKEAIVQRFSTSNSKSNIEQGISQSVDLSSMTEAQKASMISDEKKSEEHLKIEDKRKEEAKQRIFDITQNLDTAMEQKSLLSQLQNVDKALAEQFADQDAVTEAKLAKRRELLKARRRNKQNGELEDARLKDKIELIEYEQAEKKKMSEDYIKSLFKRGANDPIETQESKVKRMELLNEFLSDQFLDRLSGILMKQFLEKDQTLKNLMQKYMDQRVAEISAIQANFKIDMQALDKVEGYDPIKLQKVKKTLEFNEQSLIREVDLRLQNAQKEEESALCKDIENRHSQEQIKMRERIADEHANLRIQLLGESEMLDKEDQQEKQTLQRYEDLKKKENQRRLEKIEMEKKKVSAEFDSELNEKFKDYEDMMRKRAEKKDELQNQAVSIRDRINQNKDVLKKKAELFKGVDQIEILKNVQQNAESIEQVIMLEKREQYFKLKQKMDLRKKQVKRAVQAKEEEGKRALTNEVGGTLGKILKRRGTIIMDAFNDDDSELLKKLKEWKLRKKQYIRQKAEDLTVDMEKEQIRTMIVKLRQIEFQLKELHHEKKRKKTRESELFRQNTGVSNTNTHRQATGTNRDYGSVLGVSRGAQQSSQQSGLLQRQGSANSLVGLSKVRGTSFKVPAMKSNLHHRTSTEESGF